MPLHHRTPLLPSTPLSDLAGGPVWLKMESSQPCASFKIRGLGLACQRAVAAGATRLVSSSGGNAGLAVAWAGKTLGVPVTVVVPQSTSARMRGLMAAEGAEVVIQGAVWDDAHAHAIEVAGHSGGALLHPFDHPDLWQGHASLIHEVADSELVPGVVVVAVGGGGLLCGIAQGLHDVGWGHVPIVAVETHGAASFAGAVAAGGPITLDRIDTVALTMGAKRVCDQAFAWSTRHEIVPVLVDDDSATRACVRFANDHRTLVEPSCGAALSVVYDSHPSIQRGPVLVVVCGGAAVTSEDLNHWSPSR